MEYFNYTIRTLKPKEVAVLGPVSFLPLLNKPPLTPFFGFFSVPEGGDPTGHESTARDEFQPDGCEHLLGAGASPSRHTIGGHALGGDE